MLQETLAERVVREHKERVKNLRIIFASYFCPDCGKSVELAFLQGHVNQVFRCECGGPLMLDTSECHMVPSSERQVEREFQPCIKKGA